MYLFVDTPAFQFGRPWVHILVPVLDYNIDDDVIV